MENPACKKLFASPPEEDVIDMLMETPVRRHSNDVFTPNQQERVSFLKRMPKLVPSPTMSTGRAAEDFFNSNAEINIADHETQHLLVQS